MTNLRGSSLGSSARPLSSWRRVSTIASVSPKSWISVAPRMPPPLGVRARRRASSSLRLRPAPPPTSRPCSHAYRDLAVRVDDPRYGERHSTSQESSPGRRRACSAQPRVPALPGDHRRNREDRAPPLEAEPARGPRRQVPRLLGFPQRVWIPHTTSASSSSSDLVARELPYAKCAADRAATQQVASDHELPAVRGQPSAPPVQIGDR